MLLSGIYPFSALNPDCSFVWFWDSSWYLVLLVADGTIMYDAYSHQPCDQWYCAFYQDQLVLPVSNSYQWAVKGMGCESVTVTLRRALLVRLWVLVLLLTNMDRQFVLSWCTFELCYWPARSFSRVPRRHASLLCQWVLLYGWLTLMWRSLKMSSLLGRCDSPRCYRPIPFSCGRTNSYDVIAITPCVGFWSFHQEAWKPCLVVVLDHNNVNWWWRLYDFKGA
jgi:hypothetical protein